MPNTAMMKLLLKFKAAGLMAQCQNVHLIEEWRKLHKEELLRNWELVEQKKALFPIKPLE